MAATWHSSASVGQRIVCFGGRKHCGGTIGTNGRLSKETSILSLRSGNSDNRSSSKVLIPWAKSARKGGIKMVGGTNISQFRTFINDATPEDLVTNAPFLFSRIGTLDQSHQDRFIQQVKSDPQAKRVFEKLQTFSQ